MFLKRFLNKMFATKATYIKHHKRTITTPTQDKQCNSGPEIHSNLKAKIFVI
jgi:hypothetical protein